MALRSSVYALDYVAVAVADYDGDSESAADDRRWLDSVLVIDLDERA